MFRKFTVIIVLSALMLIIGGCGSNDKEENSGSSNEKLVPIEADLQVPETAESNETVTFSTHVTQGEENVEDASEVKYEVWKNGNKDNSEMLESKHTENGNYTAEKDFKEDGIYTIQVHVTARDMHTMPKTEINVGNVEAETHDHGEENHEHGEEHQPVTISLEQPDELKVNEDAQFKVQVENEEQPLEEAEVRFEIIQDEVEKHEWIDLSSTENAGEYSVQHSFKKEGMYHIKIHVTKGEDIHSHTMEMVEVK
jgi:hypothetical protein